MPAPGRWLLALLATIVLAGAVIERAEANRVIRLRTSDTDERSRFVFVLKAPVEYELFTLENPERIVIDIADVDLSTKLAGKVPAGSLVRRIRSASRHGDDLRVVFDLVAAGRPRSFLLEPAGSYGHRLVVDVLPRGRDAVTAGNTQQSKRPRDIVIAIDAGHGGRDPGATGPRGTYEKDVVLEVAHRLRDLLAKTPGLRPIMTRTGDVYLTLRERIQRAREAKADLFISIHADAFRDPSAKGSSVYALSLDGASSEAARWLAQRENRSAELIGGVSLDDRDRMVASVLLDLSQTATIQASLAVGEQVLEQIGDINALHKHSVQQAAFVVLKSPDIPSILVEAAFISNPREARKLRSGGYQKALSAAIRDGVLRYFENQAPRGTRIYAWNTNS